MELLPLDSEKWKNYRAGYNRVVIDTPTWIRKLMTGNFEQSHWEYLWDELHHQGDVGEASYAVVPYLAEFSRRQSRFDWHIFGFPVVVELARNNIPNPKIPEEIKSSYFHAFSVLSNIAVSLKTWDDEQTPCMAACIAVAKGQLVFARAYLEMSSTETALEFLKQEIGWEL